MGSLMNGNVRYWEVHAKGFEPGTRVLSRILRRVDFSSYQQKKLRFLMNLQAF